jgi:mono/diheme cytochrome c family protein
MKRAIAFITGAAGLVSLALAVERRITLPPETGTLRNGSGLELAQASCLTCHSSEYISTQPPMARAFWEASVKKMREKYGAPLADGDVQKLVDYLASTYGVSDKTPK